MSTYVDPQWRLAGPIDVPGNEGTSRIAFVAGYVRPEWVVIGCFAMSGGSWDLADLSVAPGPMPPIDPPSPEQQRPFGAPMGFGKWVQETHYLDRRSGSAARRSRIDSALLREIRLADMQLVVERYAPEVAAFTAQLHPDRCDPLPPPRPSHARLEYLRAAERYASTWIHQSKAEIAQSLGIDTQVLTDRLKQARALGWYEGRGSGRRGGNLTATGHQLAGLYLARGTK